MKGERQVVQVQCLHVDERTGHELGTVDEQPGPPLAVRLHVPAAVGDGPHDRQRRLGAQEVRGAGAAHQLGPRIHQRGKVIQVEFTGAVVEPGDPAFHPAAEAGQDLPAQAVPGDVVGIVLQHRRHHVVAVPEFGEQRIHDGVVRLGGVAVGRDRPPARRVQPLRDGVVGGLEPLGRPPRGVRLTAVHVLIERDQIPVQIQQRPGRLRARGVVGDDAPAADEVELFADGRDGRVRQVHAPGEGTWLRLIPRRHQPGEANPSLGNTSDQDPVTLDTGRSQLWVTEVHRSDEPALY